MLLSLPFPDLTTLALRGGYAQSCTCSRPSSSSYGRVTGVRRLPSPQASFPRRTSSVFCSSHLHIVICTTTIGSISCDTYCIYICISTSLPLSRISGIIYRPAG